MLFSSPKQDACGLESSTESMLLLLCAVFSIANSGVDELMTISCTILRRITMSFVLRNNGAVLLAQIHGEAHFCANTEESFSILNHFFLSDQLQNTI